MPSTEELLKKFAKRKMDLPKSQDAREDAGIVAPPTATFRKLKRKGAADDDPAVTLEGLFDDKDGLVGLGG
jgi:hypothetical protein